jgi:ketosteroid isomerase-like protein
MAEDMDCIDFVRQAYRLRLSSESAETAASIGHFLELLAPDVRFSPSPGVVYSGRQQVTTLLVDAAEQWSECSFEVRELRRLAAGQVLAAGVASARAAGGGETFETPFVTVWTVDGGRAICIQSFADHHQAEMAQHSVVGSNGSR